MADLSLAPSVPDNIVLAGAVVDIVVVGGGSGDVEPADDPAGVRLLPLVRVLDDLGHHVHPANGLGCRDIYLLCNWQCLIHSGSSYRSYRKDEKCMI